MWYKMLPVDWFIHACFAILFFMKNCKTFDYNAFINGKVKVSEKVYFWFKIVGFWAGKKLRRTWYLRCGINFTAPKVPKFAPLLWGGLVGQGGDPLTYPEDQFARRCINKNNWKAARRPRAYFINRWIRPSPRDRSSWWTGSVATPWMVYVVTNK